MEDDRAQVDVGIAADIEETHTPQIVANKQPKKRFVGRRTAEAATRSGSHSLNIEDNGGAIQGN
jgi:2-(3-amino-3-carboxypropyl)histidine synthase